MQTIYMLHLTNEKIPEEKFLRDHLLIQFYQRNAPPGSRHITDYLSLTFKFKKFELYNFQSIFRKIYAV